MQTRRVREIMSIFFKTYSHHYHIQTLKRLNYTVHTFPTIPYSPIPTSSAQRPQHGQRGYPCSLWDQSILITIRIFRPKTCPRKQMRHRSTPLSTQTPGKCEDEVISTGEVTRLRQQTPNIQRFFFYSSPIRLRLAFLADGLADVVRMGLHQNISPVS